LGIGFGETSADKLFTLEMTSCLGVCGVAPAMMVNERVYGNLTAERIAEVVEGLRRAK
jgi:NADH-quinone oxidoreductase subunit E